MILSAWNVSDLDKMALPPCHVLAQFHVKVETDNATKSTRKLLSCSMYQRSADLFLGVPFNITSYGLLTHMIAHVTGCVTDKLYIAFGDAHIYNNHITQVKKQLDLISKGYAFPTLKILSDTSNIDDIKYEDLIINGYNSHGIIKAPMAI
jgi:thymidylate synthase